MVPRGGVEPLLLSIAYVILAYIWRRPIFRQHHQRQGQPGHHPGEPVVVVQGDRGGEKPEAGEVG